MTVRDDRPLEADWKCPDRPERLYRELAREDQLALMRSVPRMSVKLGAQGILLAPVVIGGLGLAVWIVDRVVSWLWEAL